MIFHYQQVRQWTSRSRRRAENVPQVSDYVYEVMTENGLRPLAARVVSTKPALFYLENADHRLLA